MFTLIRVWINGCVNNRKAGDLRRYCAHYGVTVMRLRNVSIIDHNKVLTNNHGQISSNTLRARQNGRHFADDIFKCIFLNENVWFSIKISSKFVPEGIVNNTPPLVQIMARCHPGDKPLSPPMKVGLLTHVCVTRPQLVKECCANINLQAKSSISAIYVEKK